MDSQPRSLAAGLVSVVIPCFDEEEVLPLLFARLERAAESWGAPYEIILVDDGSRDSTWARIEARNSTDPRWKGVRLARNFGHQIALWTGLQHARGQVIAVLDADLQDPPEVLPRYFAKWAEGYDVVYAVRRKRKEGPLKKAAYYLYYRTLAFLSEIDIPLDSGDFCVMDRRVLDAVLLTREQVPFIRGLRAWAGFRQVALEYEREARAAGQVKYTLRKLIQLGMNGIISFSTRPLRLATYFGFAVSATAFAGVLFTLIQRIFRTQFARYGMDLPPGLATTVTAVLFLGGVQLVCLGILGEYVGRVYENVKGRPLTIISERAGVEKPTPPG
ncbi:MAG: glycosyltransferase family 2 protein [Gemmataceae bacterium]|nr:glycosyltransferase family 2 protein [Gemmataceae bacterium]